MPGPPAPLAEGWRSTLLSLTPASGPPLQVEEHRLRRGRWVVRAGHVTPHGDAGAARRRLFDGILRTLTVGELPDLSAEQDKYERNPGHPATTWDYAAALQKAGRFDEADALLVTLTHREDGWAWDAARARLRLLADRPALSAQADPAWLDRFLADAPPADDRVHRGGVRWLVERGRCDAARAHVEGFRAGIGDVTEREATLLADMEQSLSACP
jgi:hypothetical protein